MERSAASRVDDLQAVAGDIRAAVQTVIEGKPEAVDLALVALFSSGHLLDVGQCNDTYGAIQIALALANAFGCGVNDLPLNLVLSWFEQKAIAVLLTLLHLGVKGIRVGPALPAFITPNVLRILQQQFDLRPIGKSGQQDALATMN